MTTKNVTKIYSKLISCSGTGWENKNYNSLSSKISNLIQLYKFL